MNSAAFKGAYRIKYSDNISWNGISKFARFPQGIPESIDQELHESLALFFGKITM